VACPEKPLPGAVPLTAMVALALSPSERTPESSISFFKTAVAFAPAEPPISFTSITTAVPLRIVITGELELCASDEATEKVRRKTEASSLMV
jgi:hypothetical protein